MAPSGWAPRWPIWAALKPGVHRIETPGRHGHHGAARHGEVTVETLRATAPRKDVTVEVEGLVPCNGRYRLGRQLVLPYRRYACSWSSRNLEELTGLHLAQSGRRLRRTGNCRRWNGRRDRPHRGILERRMMQARTAGTLCCVRARNMTGRPAGPAPVRNWPAFTPMGNCAKERSGGRRA